MALIAGVDEYQLLASDLSVGGEQAREEYIFKMSRALGEWMITGRFRVTHTLKHKNPYGGLWLKP